MSLPPEQISIKRRREEEPVDTLYIQSELHQTKRRFTDFVFQRVTVNAKTAPGNANTALAPTQRVVRSPRSVSGLHQQTAIASGVSVPMVRATSPGAELREQKRIAAARQLAEDKLKNALQSSPDPQTSETTLPQKIVAAPPALTVTASDEPVTVNAGGASSIRRFQISKSGTPMSPLRSTGGGVQKRRADGAVAVLVEKLRREPHSRRASLVADAAARADGAAPHPQNTHRPRKRPVVNQAEKKWRAERQGAITAAKDHISQVLEKGAQSRQSNWEEESDRLARQFEQIALELDAQTHSKQAPGEARAAARPAGPKPPLKYQPRTPNKHRPHPNWVPKHEDGSESEDDYVYDTYIRHPLPDKGLIDPLVDIDSDHEAWLRHHGIDSSRQDVGVIVITPEDEVYWEDFAEEDDDEDRWDSEDGDSNAENNPANDYPDEELSWDDEEDDAAAIYRKYRHGSDDEEFDFDSGSDAYLDCGTYGRSHLESDEEW
ncbi:Iwr1 domain-containing protein [Aspergillus mulundensis]|uniref:Transcription factor Iwr1 domain-containing protein n=1 Tax=Aspergillus mulundensis TaxID=1810919 RepID=A0A3D8RLB8_9EURO|nr:Uncharacterized protein DSM5745_07356 [Aspergillus mulundensis]RDW74694.1 Uncharacterized protein DSM5745_07356 [Aspergillus mulundensis]